MELLSQYFDLQKQIYDYFGYKSEWKVYPLNDCISYYWMLVDSKVVFSEEKFTAKSMRDGKTIYSDVLYGKNAIMHGESFTMIRVDTQTDGNKFLSVFDNSKRVKDETLAQVYRNFC